MYFLKNYVKIYDFRSYPQQHKEKSINIITYDNEYFVIDNKIYLRYNKSASQVVIVLV